MIRFLSDSLMARDRLLALGVVCVCLMLGCGGETGPKRNHFSGKVTFDGKPVAMGTVYFDPDGEQGGRGPSGSAPIQDGTYDTANGLGPGTGHYLVRVEGFDGKTTPAKPFGDMLFVPHSFPVEVTTEENTKDLEVPLKAAEKLPPPLKDNPA